ncbi:MAG TPA: hypothetical protein DIV79_14505 [Opitutae bacterium]|nr:hypothetical protein [Opitutaceae bacterium]HCR31219.1 hypothetical protein [Opitutae bacterium]
MLYPLTKESLSHTSFLVLKAATQRFRNAAVFSILALLPLAPSQVVEFETMSDLVNRGANAFADGDYVQAARAFQKLESLYSEEPEWEANRLGPKIAPLAGYAALKAGLFDQAIDSLQQYVSEDGSGDGQEIFVRYTLALALKNQGKFAEALDAFAQFRAATHSVSQQSIGLVHEADIHEKQNAFDLAAAILSQVSENASTAIRIRIHARIRLLQTQLDQMKFHQAAETLLNRPWESDTMPEMALLAFLSIEAGDLFLSNGLVEEARRAYRLAPSKTTLVEKQKQKLNELTHTFKARRANVGMGGIMWTDFYEQLIGAATAQLAALEDSEDYTDPLQLRRGKSALLAKRTYEAWLIFERLSQSVSLEVAEAAHFNWILAAKELGQYEDAIAIARNYLDTYPASESVDDALSLIAHTLIDAGRYEEAINALTELITDASDQSLKTVSIYQRGQCYLRVPDYESAHLDFEQVEKLATSQDLAERASLWKGIGFFLQSNLEKSLPIFEKLKSDSQNGEIRGEAHYRYACCLYTSFDYSSCANSLSGFLTNYLGHPRQYEATLLLGDALAADNQIEAALKQYQSIPGDIGVIGHLAAMQSAQMSWDLDRFDEAIDVLEAQLEFTKDAYKSTEIQLLAVDFRFKLGDTEQAVDLLRETISTNGDSPEAENLLQAIDVIASTKEIQAISLKDAALANNQFRLAARYWLFHALELKNADRVFQYRETLLALANEIPIERLPPECLAHVGLEMARLDFNIGQTMLQRLVALYPDSFYTPFAYFGFAIKEAEAKQYSLALGWLNRMGSNAVGLPIHVDSMIFEAQLRIEVQEYERAQEILENALSLRWATSEQKADCLLALAELKTRHNRPEQAIAYCQRVFTLYPGATDAAAAGYFRSAQHLAEIEEPGKAKEVLEEFLGRSEYRHTIFFEQAKKLLTKLSAEQSL